jgi:hypothetical protein
MVFIVKFFAISSFCLQYNKPYRQIL